MGPSAARLMSMTEWKLIENQLDRLENDYCEELISVAGTTREVSDVAAIAAKIEMVRMFRGMPEDVIGETE